MVFFFTQRQIVVFSFSLLSVIKVKDDTHVCLKMQAMYLGERDNVSIQLIDIHTHTHSRS